MVGGGSGGGRGGGSTDLHSAARSGDLTAVQYIISSNPLAVNSRDKHSRTPYPSSSSKITRLSIFVFWLIVKVKSSLICFSLLYYNF